MSSFGWYILGYFGMGALVWIIGAVVIAIAAAVSDYKWDCEHDPSMSRTDTLDTLISIGDNASEMLEDICNAEDNPREAKMRCVFKVLLLWPWALPKAYTEMWSHTVELRNRRR